MHRNSNIDKSPWSQTLNWTISTIYDSFVLIIICLATNWTLKQNWNLCATCVHKFTMKSRRRAHDIIDTRRTRSLSTHSHIFVPMSMLLLSVVRFSVALRKGKNAQAQSMIIDCEILFSFRVARTLVDMLIDSSMRGSSECVRKDREMHFSCASPPHTQTHIQSSKPTPHKKQQAIFCFFSQVNWSEVKWKEKNNKTKRISSAQNDNNKKQNTTNLHNLRRYHFNVTRHAVQRYVISL